MAVKLRRPILVGGIGLSFLLWLLQGLHDSVAQLSEISVLSAIAIFTGFWLFQHRVKDAQIQPDNLPIDRARVEKEIALAQGIISQLEIEVEHTDARKQPSLQAALAPLQEKITQLGVQLNRQGFQLTITGGKAVGKSSLLQLLKTTWVPQQLEWQETPALFAGKDTNLTSEKTALQAALNSDLVLFITNGDLTDSEWQVLQQLTAANQRTILVFNKQDQYLPDERAIILHSLQQRTPSLGKENVVAVSAAPGEIKVRQHQADGSVQEWMEQSIPDITQLTQQLSQILVQEGQQLIWATNLRTAVALKAEAKVVLNGVRRDRALPMIEQYQWIAATAAFANPVPALDLLATAAINAQLVLELGAIYQQKFSLQQAQTVAGAMGSLMLKLGLVELSTKAISTVLKSNAITFVAGGVLQGVSAAYLTRLASLSLIEYFQNQELATNGNQLNLDKLGQTLQNVFQQNQQIGFLKGFVKQGMSRLLPQSPQPQLTVSETA